MNLLYPVGHACNDAFVSFIIIPGSQMVRDRRSYPQCSSRKIGTIWGIRKWAPQCIVFNEWLCDSYSSKPFCSAFRLPLCTFARSQVCVIWVLMPIKEDEEVAFVFRSCAAFCLLFRWMLQKSVKTASLGIFLKVMERENNRSMRRVFSCSHMKHFCAIWRALFWVFWYGAACLILRTKKFAYLFTQAFYWIVRANINSI